MKKFLLFLLLFIPTFVFAAPIKISCPGKVAPGEIFNCTLIGMSDYSTIDATLNYSKASYYGEKTRNNYSSKSSEGESVYLSYSKTTEGLQDIDIVVLEFSATGKSGETITINLNNFTVVLDKTKISQSDISKTIKIEAPTTTTTISKKTFTATLDGNGGKLNKNTVSCDAVGTQCAIDVSDITGMREGFVFKGFDTSSDCRNISEKTLRLKKDTTYYACWDSKSNTSSTTTTSKTTSSTTTTTTTTKKADLSLYLDSLSISNIDFEFIRYKNDYDLKVLYDVSTVEIAASSENNDINIEYDKTKELVVGDNTIIITLTDKEDNKSEYKINIKRLAEGEKLDNPEEHDASLSALDVEGYDIGFNSNIKSYDLVLPKSVTILKITPVPSQKEAKFVVSGNHDLKSGSVIKVTVQALDGETRDEYTINILTDSLIKQYSLYIICGLILIVIVLVIIAVITNEKTHKNKEISSKNKNKNSKSKIKKEKIDVFKL